MGYSNNYKPFQITINKAIDIYDNVTKLDRNTYVMYNYSWNGYDYPAKVWMKYKIRTTDENYFSTQIIEVSNEIQKKEVKKFLIEQIAEKVKINSQFNNINEYNNELFYLYNLSNNINLLNDVKLNFLPSYMNTMLISNLKYQLWMISWTTDATLSTIEELKKLSELNLYEAASFLKSKTDKPVYLFELWDSKLQTMLFPNNEYLKSRLEYYSNKVEIEWNEVLKMMNKVEEFIDEILYVLQNLDKIQNKEYREWYIRWYFSEVIWESVWITIATSNAWVAFDKFFSKTVNSLKTGDRFVHLIKDLTLAIKLAQTYNSKINPEEIISLTKGVTFMERSILTDKVLLSWALAQKYWILNYKTIFHLINWEWNDAWKLTWWLHSMTTVEEYLKKWYIRVKIMWQDWNWIDVNYDQYMSSWILKNEVKIIDSTWAISVKKNGIVPKKCVNKKIG